MACSAQLPALRANRSLHDRRRAGWFWANYYGRILTGTVTTPPIIQFHAAVFLGWLLLVTAQAVLAQAFNDWVMALYT